MVFSSFGGKGTTLFCGTKSGDQFLQESGAPMLIGT